MIDSEFKLISIVGCCTFCLLLFAYSFCRIDCSPNDVIIIYFSTWKYTLSFILYCIDLLSCLWIWTFTCTLYSRWCVLEWIFCWCTWFTRIETNIILLIYSKWAWCWTMFIIFLYSILFFTVIYTLIWFVIINEIIFTINNKISLIIG